MTRYKVGTFWKQGGDCCDFMEILESSTPDSTGVDLRVSWNTQLDGKWKTLVSSMFIRLREKDLKKWNSYSPKGAKK